MFEPAGMSVGALLVPAALPAPASCLLQRLVQYN
jgi:hypothetical protein